MPSINNVVSPSPPTQKQILSYLLEATGDLDTAQTLQKSLPHRLLNASVTTLAALEQTARDLHAAQAKVEVDLNLLSPLNDFCFVRLNNAVAARWPGDIDVEKDFLELPGAACGCEPTIPPGGGQPVYEPARVTLLEAAMQNFTEEEAQTGGLPEGSVIRIANEPGGVPGLTPSTFAAFCRELDLGRSYQRHFQQVFGLKEVDGKTLIGSPMIRDITTLKKLLLQFDLHLALAKDHITQDGFQTVQRLIDAGGSVSAESLRYQGRPLIMQGIEIHGCCIWSVVVFSERNVELYPEEWCLVYMPGEPDQPLYEYASFTAFVEYLGFKLGIESYKAYFTHCLGEADKADFFSAFASSRSLGHVKQLAMAGPLFDYLLKSHVAKLQFDARALAVPTADVDEDEREKRLLHYLEIGMTVANLAGLVVPVLGQLMMGVAVGQLLAEVYEGIEDWSRGDRQEALTHMLSVAENIALMAAVGAGIKGLKSLAIKTVRKHPEFFEPFTTILDRNGQSRLWKSELVHYRQSLPAGIDMKPDAAGFYRVNDEVFIRMGDQEFAVQQDPVSGRWQVRHPRRATAYAPGVEQGRHGGWRHASERADQWSSAYMLKRIDPMLAEFEDADLDMMRRLSGLGAQQLHRLCESNRSLPARFQDTVERFRLERRLREFIAAMKGGEASDTRYVQEQLHALPRLTHWPADHYIKVIDDNGRISATYPANTIDDDTVSLVVRQNQLEKGELLQTVLAGMSAEEKTSLLGGGVSVANERSQLAKKLGAEVGADRTSVFEHMYRRLDQTDSGKVMKARNAYPDIPARHLEEMLRQSASVERLHLRTTGRIPMGLAQRCRQASDAVRVERALTGFYLADIANADTQKLAIRLLPQLSGWDSTLSLQMRELTLKGAVLESVGPHPFTSANARTLVRLKNGYEVFDSQNRSLGRIASGPDSLYQAILESLPAGPRKALGFADARAEDGARLRSRLLDVAMDEREGCARLLRGEPFELPVEESSCTLADSPVETPAHSRRLLRKVKKLFPLFTDQQANEFLDQAGGDHLTRALRVRELQEYLRRLRDVMDVWMEDQAAMKALGGPLTEVHECRQIVAFEIEDCFCRLVFQRDEFERPVYGLNLDGMRCGKLPMLPPGLTFEHVRYLSLQNMLVDNDVAYFLKAFKNVESLSLDSNQLTRLPEVISHMPNLKHLSLENNRIQLTEQALVKLSRLRTLQSLNLSGNHLGATVDVGNLFDLNHLYLRNTRATELPKGLRFLPNLKKVDLRDNDIRDLPDWLFETSRRFSETINLRNNPISDTSKVHLDSYRKSVGVGMGYLENDPARLDENLARSIWLTETGGTVGSRHLQTWTAIKDDPMAEGLFQLLAELGNSAESVHVRKDMSRRVWNVLEATQADAELRQQIFDLAANPINCTDNAALNFSHLEVAVQVRRVTRASGGRKPSAPSLIKLARGLFRLEQLDNIAAEHAATRSAPDPLEVALAYRSGLAEALELPGQPSHMLYASIAQVTGADLLEAIDRVQTAELSPEWLTFLVRQPFWNDYVKSSFGTQFDDARAPFHEEAQALFERSEELSSVDYLSEMNGCAARLEQAESALLERLTDQVLRLVEGSACVLPGS
ncbi:NEL-type E3 ubiquitin ligase domain-containing protein [Pseudomonas bananamidigenes]|uniref:NEL-type E3 ubiquitin ligase domain-containing protein n=1 Tax=Pseudomonas bananamidigenes TaxID=2843610 RepID=UPI000803A592|nr:NEL-type E3 ubiquitin ligase domain-containing protein [Pseudomonas bananamidigenes]